MPDRMQQLERWLDSCCLPPYRLEPASSDASFRRYFRVVMADGTTQIAMDAPPDKEDCRPFVTVAARMAAAGLHVPEIHAQNIEEGFLLLEDLGSEAYLAALDEDSVDALYGDALDQLLCLQRDASIEGLPSYNRALLLREMRLFPDWLVDSHLGLALGEREQQVLSSAFEALIANALAQPVVFVHRDFHSRNLMVVPQRNPGVIDFQDAVAGPVTYDLVSLLRDCYVRWPMARVDAWVARYYRRAASAGLVGDAEPQAFLAWFDLMGVQRHLKAAGIFARLCHRDGKRGYLADVPRTLRYVVEVGQRRDQMAPLAELIATRVLPAL